MPNSDQEGPDIIEISPGILDTTNNVLKVRIRRSRRPIMVAVSLAILAAVAVVAMFAARQARRRSHH